MARTPRNGQNAKRMLRLCRSRNNRYGVLLQLKEHKEISRHLLGSRFIKTCYYIMAFRPAKPSHPESDNNSPHLIDVRSQRESECNHHHGLARFPPSCAKCEVRLNLVPIIAEKHQRSFRAYPWENSEASLTIFPSARNRGPPLHPISCSR